MVFALRENLIWKSVLLRKFGVENLPPEVLNFIQSEDVFAIVQAVMMSKSLICDSYRADLGRVHIFLHPFRWLGLREESSV